MPIGSDGEDGTENNEGPHCRNCHTGANNCYVCHSDDSVYNVSSAYTGTITGKVSNRTNYAAQSFLRQSAVAGTGVGEACLDGGFSFPHRTLGEDMLKDELYGIDFDGSRVEVGEYRTTNAVGGSVETTSMAGFTFGLSATQVPGFEFWTAEDRNSTSIIPAVRNDNPALENAQVENLDSVCIDCHGDGTYWNGDDAAFYTTETEVNMTNLGVYGSGERGGWELLLRGLP